MSADWPNVGLAIRHAREAKKMSQAQLGAAVGVSAPAISRIETRGNLNLPMLRRIVRAVDSRSDVIIRYAEQLDLLGELVDRLEKRREVAALEQQVKKRAERRRQSGKL